MKKKYHRCPICGKASEDDENFKDENGYKCPNGCERSFEQPKYEMPNNDN